ncbi:Thyroid adenoma-associated protein like protein [Chelonia mydas]|uniref:tRNA (32-2'-O)-methyltransferase regulator THADA n=1 Tax=Chelonia mydas TaxID=8469 RepID=M7CCX9_CHEMY|nr:Thyroid adenoma-associated protein like protein [Chelonia mydas]
MVLKKKKEIQVDAFVLECQELETLQSFADAEDQNLASLLLHCVQLSDGIHQIYCIKQIVTLLKKMDRNSACSPMIKCCLDIVGVMYFSLGAKNPLKKVLASSLNGLPEHITTEAVHSFVRCLKEELKTTDLSLYRKVMDNLASCMENFSLVIKLICSVLCHVKQEGKKLSGNSIAETRLMHDLLMAIKVSMMLLQKVQENFQGNLWKKPSSLVWQSMCGLVKSFTNFLMDGGLLPTVQTTSGLAVILFTKTMFEPVEKLPCLVSDLLLHSVNCASVPEWFVSSCGSLCTEELSDSVLLFLCHGALAMLEWKNGSMGENGEKLLLDIALVLLSLASQLKESNMAVSLSRILAIWTNSALDVLESSSQNLKCSLNGNSNTTGKLLEYVYTHWEHPLDAVRHQAKLIFKNIVRIHQATLKGSVVKSDPFLSMLTESLLSLEWHVKGKYASLGSLVECVGVENILTVDRTIPAQILDVMSDQTLAPYASDLLETMFINHKSHLISAFQKTIWINHWHDTWVSPLLLILCEGNPDQTTYVIDYYLPKLLKCSPDSLSYMIKILQASADANIGSCNTRGALGALMACLRTARAHGHLQFREIMRDGLLSTGCVKQGLVHQHNQLFCRIQESSQVLYKLEQSKTKQELIKESAKWDHFATLQQYKDFISSICDKLFEALFPGSSHPTRFSSLTILGSIAEIFSAPEGQTQAVFQLAQEIDSTRVQTLIQCFASTFEEVKVLAFELLMKLHDMLDLQDSENLHLLFQAAMDLSISTKPYDCVTASYLLNFLIHHKGLLNVCLKYQQVAHTFQINEDMSASTMEKNTLAVIKYLLANLEREIFQAEKSLLQAAASFPMYGRVHCITGALQQLPLNDQHPYSTSPSATILLSPTETSEGKTAGRLQMILHEIQPRDTNDYFTQAKILKEHHRVDFEKLTDNEPVENVCPEITGKESQTCDVTAQMVLVCCWRSMKEISLLLGMLCKLLPLQTVSESSDGLITVEQVKDIGDYFKHHLLQSRHRGAFELAYTGFVMLTEILSRCTSESLRTLPQQWLYNVLEEIKTCDPSSKLCATRRSAGIPFYIQALLASEPKKSKTSLLKITMNELISLAVPVNESPNIIPQVHSLNILRALFRDTRFGENIIPYIADGIQATILGFTSPVWAVRNSSTLLFSTLITRIFGVKRGKDENSKKNSHVGYLCPTTSSGRAAICGIDVGICVNIADVDTNGGTPFGSAFSTRDASGSGHDADSALGTGSCYGTGTDGILDTACTDVDDHLGADTPRQLCGKDVFLSISPLISDVLWVTKSLSELGFADIGVHMPSMRITETYPVPCTVEHYWYCCKRSLNYLEQEGGLLELLATVDSGGDPCSSELPAEGDPGGLSPHRMTGREFFSRFPALYPFLLQQLEVAARTMDSETGELKLHPSLFLLLLILGKLYPSPMDGTYSALSMAPFVPFIMRCGHSPVYRSREMAGRALVPFVMINQIPHTVQSLLAGLPECTNPCIRQNSVHGLLLQVEKPPLLLRCLQSWAAGEQQLLAGCLALKAALPSAAAQKRDKSTAKRSPVDSRTPPGREAQAESTGEHQPLTYCSEDTAVNRSKYVDFSYVIPILPLHPSSLPPPSVDQA